MTSARHWQTKYASSYRKLVNCVMNDEDFSCALYVLSPFSPFLFFSITSINKFL